MSDQPPFAPLSTVAPVPLAPPSLSPPPFVLPPPGSVPPPPVAVTKMSWLSKASIGIGAIALALVAGAVVVPVAFIIILLLMNSGSDPQSMAEGAAQGVTLFVVSGIFALLIGLATVVVATPIAAALILKMRRS